MSAPLTGSKKQTAAGGWQVSLPIATGSNRRITWTFKPEAEAAADRWLAQGRAALAERRRPPEPAAADLSRPRRGDASTPFLALARPWRVERYDEIRTGGVDRAAKVDAHITRIDTWMREHGRFLETMYRDHVKEFQASLTRTGREAAPVTVPDGLDPDALVTMQEARALPGMVSLSTLKRRKAEGRLRAADTTGGVHRYRVGDLYTEAVLGQPGASAAGGVVSQGVANDVMWVFNQVCLFAKDYGVAVPQDRDSLAMHRTDKPAGPKRQPVSYARCADIAARLHVVHQTVLFLMRIMGLRIGEAYGIRVDHLVDRGPDEQGILFVKAQGGKKYKRREQRGSAVVTTDHVEEVKNENSYRVLVVPPALMALLRAVIAVFHTDANGSVRRDARLVPGLQRSDAAGQGAFRTALAKAAAAAGVDCSADEEELDETFSCSPHDMRRSVLSDLDRLEIKASHSKRFAGHAAGVDVHHRHYILDDPRLRPVRKIARLLEQELAAEMPHGLLVPTLVRCTTGAQPVLAAEAARVDAELAELGWLVRPDLDGDPLLSTAEVATELGISVTEARRRMADGRIPSLPWEDHPRGVQRRSRLSDVQKVRDHLRSQITLRDIADEVGQPYHTVYQFVRAHSIELQRSGPRDHLVPDPAAERLRAHYARQRALHARAVPLSVAAATLGVDAAIVTDLIARGDLTEDERAHDRRRMVTRDSVDRVAAARRRPRRELLVRWEAARAALGYSDAQLDALIAAGQLTLATHRQRRHVTRASLLHHTIDEHPELLAEVAGLPIV